MTLLLAVMLTAMAESASIADLTRHNDGNGSIEVMLQVPKSEADDAYATVRVRFRFTPEKSLPEMLGAELLKEE